LLDDINLIIHIYWRIGKEKVNVLVG